MNGTSDDDAFGETGRLHNTGDVEIGKLRARRVVMAGKKQVVTSLRTVFFNTEQQKRLRGAKAEIVEQNESDDMRLAVDNAPGPVTETIAYLSGNGFHPEA